MPERPGDSSAEPLVAGDLVAGKYRVERVLGSGGMGVVVAARHEELDQLVAIKLLRPDLVQTDIAIGRFQREARAAARIQSDHVARVFDVGKLDDGRVYMVMEHLQGVDLSALVAQRGALPIAEAVGYVLEALEAVAHAHAEGIIHRDLKPSNLFLTTRPDGTRRIKVLDFGISKSSSPLSRPAGPGAEALTTADAILGSPGYMSPEQVKSTKDVDGRTDIWSIGVILYELLTGIQPFAGETVGEILANILEGPPAPVRSKRPDLPEELANSVMRCLSRDRAARFASAAELADAIAPFANDAMRSTTERISLILSRSSNTSADAEPRARISTPGGARVSQTADTFDAAKPAPKSAQAAEIRDGERQTSATSATLAAGTWAGKPERADGSRRKVAALTAIGVVALLGGLFAWRITAAPENPRATDERPVALAASPAPTASPALALPSAVPVVTPSAEAEAASATLPAGEPKRPSTSPTTSSTSAPPSSAGKPSTSASASKPPSTTKPPNTKSIPADLLRERD